MNAPPAVALTTGSRLGAAAEGVRTGSAAGSGLETGVVSDSALCGVAMLEDRRGASDFLATD